MATKIPRQWKLIALYMVIAYLAFVAAINIAKHDVIEEERVHQSTGS